MERYNIYIEELIRKEILGTLTTAEIVRLAEEKDRYSEEEFDRMVIDVLRNMEDPFPDDPLKQWEPDYAEILRRGKIEEYKRRKVKQRRIYGLVSIAASVLILVGIVFVAYKEKQQRKFLLALDPSCSQSDPDGKIPMSLSNYVLTYGRTQVSAAFNSRRPMQVGNIRATRQKDGLLVLELISEEIGDSESTSLEISTQARQQCVVQLPNGARIRLDAQSVLKYPIEQPYLGHITATIIGYALIEKPQQTGALGLRIRTDNGSLVMDHGQVNLMAINGMTQATLSQGKAILASDSANRTVSLDCGGAQALLVRMGDRIRNISRDTLMYSIHGDFEREIRWTKAMKHYENASLREFITEVSHWQGLKVKDVHCIPTEPKVNLTVCYAMNREQVLAAIRNQGVKLYSRNDMISFCPEDTDKELKSSKSRLAFKSTSHN